MENQFNLSLDPETAENYHDQTLPAEGANWLLLFNVWTKILFNENFMKSRFLTSDGKKEMSEKFKKNLVEKFIYNKF